MTMRMTLEPTARVRGARRVRAIFAVALARGLVRLSPRRLRAVLTTASRGAGPTDPDRALLARNAVVAVSKRCAAQQCLQRSVAAALLCRMSGRWPTWCTGIRVQPFRAHAWIEAGGQPVGEESDMSLYVKVMEVRSRAR
ncbi:lasso peptide biosynthesis B2 protein [Amycolatopsis silviterrae]|uniref:Lasso peptide biosynthesis B2 protein n=1 Tax=Amycolatopsis silviterrae TaxID=1656914 RepID=A0ABW5H8V0_9PSEU